MWKFTSIFLMIVISYLLLNLPTTKSSIASQKTEPKEILRKEFVNLVDATITVSGYGGWDERYFTRIIERGESLIFEEGMLPKGLMQIQVHCFGVHNSRISTILDSPNTEYMQYRWHKNVIFIGDRNQRMKIYGGPKGSRIENWQPIQMTTDYLKGLDLSTYPYKPRLAHGRELKWDEWAWKKAKKNKMAIASTISIVVLPHVFLPIFGFTTSGIAAGSFAATIQSYFYGGLTGGLFSIFQSLGMLGGLPAGLKAAFALFGVSKNLKWIWFETVLFSLQMNHKMQGAVVMIPQMGEFKPLESIAFFPDDYFDQRNRTGLLCTFTQSSSLLRYRLEFSNSELDFELQVPAFSGEKWREFIYMDSKYLIGETLETIYVLEPKTKNEIEN